jgi:Protein of unknown function (DUF3710)
VFRRRRRENAGQPGPVPGGVRHGRAGQDQAGDDLALADEEPAFADQDAPAGDEPGLPGDEPGLAGEEGPDGGAAGPPTGPWDAHDEIPPADRIDFGSLQVPVSEGLEIQLNLAEDQGPLVAVLCGDSSLLLQAFAAPKSDGLWEDVRHEIAAAVVEAGGTSEEAAGRFGPELRARVTAPDPAAGGRPGALQPIRFLGVDGPRWFLRGVLTGPAAHHRSAAEPLEDIFAGIVVVRGDHPAPPRDLLEIQLPEQARQAMEEQMAEAEARSLPSPFERGPEITETR